MEFRVYFCPSVESKCKPFIKTTNSLSDARLIASTLGEFTLHTHNEQLMKDDSNFVLIERFAVDEWVPVEDDEIAQETFTVISINANSELKHNHIIASTAKEAFMGIAQNKSNNCKLIAAISGKLSEKELNYAGACPVPTHIVREKFNVFASPSSISFINEMKTKGLNVFKTTVDGAQYYSSVSFRSKTKLMIHSSKLELLCSAEFEEKSETVVITFANEPSFTNSEMYFVYRHAAEDELAHLLGKELVKMANLKNKDK